jgi:glycerol kinase
MKYILALDQGTTSSRSILFDRNGEIAAVAQKEFTQYFPEPGWVEHDPEEIWESQVWTIDQVLHKSGITMSSVVAIGITNQRETTVVWDRKTGKAIYNAIVWQDRRTADQCQVLKDKGLEFYVKEKTGLLPDAYFSGTKVHWILKNVPDARKKANAGDLIFGTIDSWLIQKLTDGEVHATDYTNASRTMLFDIHRCGWDLNLLKELDIPEQMLPVVQPSSSHFGETSETLFGTKTPISGVGGDQQAALFGQLCHEPGMVKNTYGTGCFMLMHTGHKPVSSNAGLLTTMACNLSHEPVYAIEGSVFVGGAAIQWLRDGLGILADSSESESIARSVADNGGVYFVPAFTGLGTPHWDMFARGSLFGLTRGTTSAHIVRATLESIAFQSAELLETMRQDAGFPIQGIRVDGGASSNDFLMKFQADIANIPVLRPSNIESTAVGAAYLAGLSIGFWTLEKITKHHRKDKVFSSTMSEHIREAHLKKWKKAIERSKHWEIS